MSTLTDEERIEALLGMPPFDALDDDGREALAFEARLHLGLEQISDEMPQREAYLRFESCGPGDTVVCQGDLTTEFVVVCQGEVQASHGRRGGEPIGHTAYGMGDWFGEVSALSHHPSLSTCTVEDSAELAILDARLFVKLCNENADFQERIDARYRGRHLALHLASSAMLRDLEPAELEQIAARAELRRLREGEVLVRQGAAAETFFLVRSGALECRRERRDGASVVLAYYRGNSSLGEHSIATDDAIWPGTCVALASADVVAIPRAVFQRLPADAQRVVTAAGNRVLDRHEPDPAAAPGCAAASFEDELHVMVAGESVKGGEALVIDQRSCVRCNLCIESCVAVHRDGIPRLSKVGTRITTDEVLITACYHCETPECMLSCEYGAIRRDPQGRVRFEYDNCVGCAACIEACPYGVIRYVDPATVPTRRPTWLDRVPWLGRLLGAAPPPPPPALDDAAAAEDGGDGRKASKKDSGPKQRVVNVGGETPVVAGKTIKCDLCAGLPFEACVYNCPTSAIHRRKPESLFAPERRR